MAVAGDASRSRPGLSGLQRSVWPAVAGAVAGAAVSFVTGADVATLIGWDVAGLGFLLLVWTSIRTMDGDATESHAGRLDPSRRLSDLLVTVAAVAVLAGVGLALAQAGHAHGSRKGYLIAVGVSSVALGWLVVHTVFTLRYAHLYYTTSKGGIDFNEPDAPAYIDFAYLAFTVGMTFQVSDTSLASKEIRRAALQQALVSYLFGAVILGLVVNIVASLL